MYLWNISETVCSSYRMSCVDKFPLLLPQGVQLSLLLLLHLLQLSLQLIDSVLTIKRKVPISVGSHMVSAPLRKSHVLIHLAGLEFTLIFSLNCDVMMSKYPRCRGVRVCVYVSLSEGRSPLPSRSLQPRHNANQMSVLQVKKRHKAAGPRV